MQIILCNENEGTINGNNIDKPPKYYLEWKNPGTKEYTILLKSSKHKQKL